MCSLTRFLFPKAFAKGLFMKSKMRQLILLSLFDKSMSSRNISLRLPYRELGVLASQNERPADVRPDRVVRSHYPSVEIPKISYPQFALQQMDKFHQKIFLVNGETGAKYSYHQSLSEVTRVASALIRLGLKRGDRVAFYSFNRPEYALAWFAATSIGAVVTDANPNFTADELHSQLKLTNCQYLFTHVFNVQTAKRATSCIYNFKLTFVFGEAHGCVPYSFLTRDSGDLFQGPVSADPSDLVHLPCSSGTTGLPKAVMRTHTAALATTLVTDYADVRVFEEHDTGLILLPFFHIFGSSMIGNCLLVGSCIVTHEKFNPQDTLAYIQKYKVTSFPVVPPLVQFFIQHPAVLDYDLSSLKSILCGAASIEPELLERMAHKLSLKTARQGYGATEMCPISIMAKSESSYSSTGTPVCNSEVKVVSLQNGLDLDIGEEGEIWARGPQITSGYENDTEATSRTFVDGWVKTGDIGFVNSEGHLHLIDRLKDIMKVKGHQVAPRELETLLLTHPSVLEAAVVGIPDPKAGEVPRAFVVLKDKSVKTKDIEAYVEERICPEKRLTGGIIVLDQIPNSSSGKVLKRELRTMT